MMTLKSGSGKMERRKLLATFLSLVNMESESERNNGMKEPIFCP